MNERFEQTWKEIKKEIIRKKIENFEKKKEQERDKESQREQSKRKNFHHLKKENNGRMM